MNLTNFIVFFIYIASTFTLLYFLIKSIIDKRKLVALYIQSEIDKYLYGKKIEEILKELSTRELSESDGFIKFISQSRDWAFQYIEEVQAALTEFDKTMEPALDWYKSFGMVLGETAHTDVLKRISEAYDKLKSVLPENNETPNN